MTQSILTRLSATSFRGIRSASIPLNGMNLILIGENGSGKSCFVDLLEYLFTGQLARLKRQDVKEKESIAFVGRQPGESVAIEISLSLNGGVYDISSGYPYSEPELPPAVTDWLHRMRAHPPILRRAQILDFVEAKGANRYKQISMIIGLDDVDEILDCWRRLGNDFKRERVTLERSLQDAQASLRQLLEVTAQADLIDGVNQRLAEVDMPPISSICELDERLKAFQLRADVTTAAQEAARLEDYASTLDRIGVGTSDFLSMYAVFHGAWSSFIQQKDSWKDALFRELLDQGQKVLTELADLDVCPLCQSPIDRVELLEALRPRIAELDLIRDKMDGLETTRTGLARQVAQISQQVQMALSASQRHCATSLAQLVKGLGGMESALQRDVLEGQYPTSSDVEGISWMTLLQSLAEASRSLMEEARRLKPLELEQKRAEVAAWLGQVQQASRDEQHATKVMGTVVQVCRHLDLMSQSVTQAREECLERIHVDIESRINSYYQELHPEEGYGEIQLPVERKGRAVGLRTLFHGVQASHPSGFYSEGHLDCVGIAIFLAFIRRTNPDGGLLVLDDVVTTIDSGHRQRLATLLAREFEDYQVIITTHDRLWAEELLTTMAAFGLRRLALHLQPWNVDRGVGWVEFLELRWDEYQQRAEASPQSAVADTGRDLERLLCLMRYHLLLSVPARAHDQYTIGNLYDPFFAWFRKHSVQRTDLAFDDTLSSIRQKMDAYWRVRNWCGAHYNAWGETLSPTEAKDFITLVETLDNLFRCPCCSSLVQYDEGSSVLYCAKCRGKADGAVWRVVKKRG